MSGKSQIKFLLPIFADDPRGRSKFLENWDAILFSRSWLLVALGDEIGSLPPLENLLNGL